MLQTCSIIAGQIAAILVDDDIGFSDFLNEQQDVLVMAVQRHWHYMAEKDARFKDPTDHDRMYMDLVRIYMNRTSKPVNPQIYRAYIRLLADIELKKLPIFQRAA